MECPPLAIAVVVSRFNKINGIAGNMYSQLRAGSNTNEYPHILYVHSIF
jgi:hypothetical protein